MTAIYADRALTPGGWETGVRLVLEAGRIRSVATGVSPRPADECHAVLLPGMANLHSHAFQRAMAGLAERRGPGPDSFWSWREQMYRFALSMSPDHVEAVAGQLYVEMLEAGFTRVGEFHYLHNDMSGRPYSEIGEMASRLAAASASAGIGLALLPAFYAHSGFGGAPPAAEQRRFVTDIERFGRIVESCARLAGTVAGMTVGIAPHSLRAVTPAELACLLSLDFDGPIHMHVAEQEGEVEDCLAWSGARPVEWLLDNAPVDARWCLVHATHMTHRETRRLAASGAVAGLCPLTEANLGDGVFDAPGFLAAGGRFGIGSDSNILIGVTDELRQLEYSQRLVRRARNVLASAEGSTGAALFGHALAGGAAALMWTTGLAAGLPADFVSLRPRHDIPLAADSLLDRWIFAEQLAVDCVWVGGARRVESGMHVNRRAVASRFEGVMKNLSVA